MLMGSNTSNLYFTSTVKKTRFFTLTPKDQLFKKPKLHLVFKFKKNEVHMRGKLFLMTKKLKHFDVNNSEEKIICHTIFAFKVY